MVEPPYPSAVAGVEDRLAQGQRALDRGDVPGALAAFEAALLAGDSGDLRQLVGGLSYAEDDLDAARAHWEVAFRLHRQAGRRRAAARVAAALADVHGSALGNRAAGLGWVRRGERVLEPEGRCVERGYLLLAFIACDVPDVAQVERSAATALELALEFDDRDLEVRALADGGLALISEGRTVEGFARLDEALAALTAGAVTDPEAMGTSFCAMMSACDRAGDLERAQEWTRLIHAVVLDPLRGRPRVLHTHCRSAYGSVLGQMGRWAEAEQVLGEVLETGSRSAFHRMLSSCHLAELRIQQGRLGEAAALLRPWTDSADAYCPRAQLHLASGEQRLAAAVAVAGLAVLRADVLRGIPLLAVLVRAHLAGGDLAAARVAADRLGALADRAGLRGPQAEALLAHGLVAAAGGHDDEALEALHRARAALGGEGRPMVRAAISCSMAEVLLLRGQVELAVREAEAALETYRGLGARPDVDRTRALLRRLGVRSHTVDRLAGPLTPREQEVLELLCEGLTNAQIGQRLSVTPKTAEHHVGRVLAKLGVRSRAQAIAACRPPALQDGSGAPR